MRKPRRLGRTNASARCGPGPAGEARSGQEAAVATSDPRGNPIDGPTMTMSRPTTRAWITSQEATAASKSAPAQEAEAQLIEFRRRPSFGTIDMDQALIVSMGRPAVRSEQMAQKRSGIAVAKQEEILNGVFVHAYNRVGQGPI
jgi:hypothetical protein